MNDQAEQQPSSDTQDRGQVLYEWRFREFPKYDRTRQWYFWGGVVTLGFLTLAIMTGNYLFGLIILMLSGIALMLHRSDNEIVFSLTEEGIFLNKRFHDYKSIRSFFIIYEPPQVKTLYFEPRSILNPRIPVPLEDQNPVTIRETLLQYLQENLDREEEPFTDQIGRMFKL